MNNDVRRPAIKEFILAGYPCLFMQTVEPQVAESRVRAGLSDLKMTDMDFGVWKVTTGLLVGRVDDAENQREEAKDLIDALAVLEKRERSMVGVFHNLRQFVSNYQIIQQMIDTIFAIREKGSHLILVGPHLELPPELKPLVTYVDCPLPTQAQILEEYRKFARAYEEDIQLPESKEEREDLLKAAANAAVGLDMMGAENAIALSLATAETVDLPIIQAQKELKVKQSDVLEFIETQESMNNVGGFAGLKQWLVKRQRAFTSEAKEYGLASPKGMLLVGVAGCLAGDTDILLKRKGGMGARNETLEALYYRFNGLHAEGVKKGVISKHKRKWSPGKRTYIPSLREEDGYFFYNEIETVVFSGVKEVYKVKTDQGFFVKGTREHEFYVPDEGYILLSDLNVGDTVVARGVGELLECNKRGRNKNILLIQMSNVGNHPNARSRIVNGLVYSTHPLHRLVVEAHLNDMPLEDFLYALHGDVEGLTFLDSNVEVHHEDENRRNNSRGNLEVLTKKEHARIHWHRRGNPDKYRLMGRTQKIVSIELVGKEPTFDIRMRAPYNNFAANGLVVHNSGKSLCAKATASYLKLPLLRMDVGKIFRSLVGESESAMRLALQVVEAVSPAVLWIDELERGLAGMKGSGELDSGVTSRVVSTLLTWRQETKAPVFLVGTCNDVAALPSMVYRKGRLDEVWATDLPTEEEREEIFRIHLRKRKRDPDDFDCALLAVNSEEMVGAEIETCIEDAMFSAFDRGDEVSTSYILSAIRETVPQAQRDKEEVQAIREWVSTRARLVAGGNKPKPKSMGSKVRKIHSKRSKK